MSGVLTARDSTPLSFEDAVVDASMKLSAEDPLPVFHIESLLARTFPPRRMLLEPWLSERSTAMVYGARGVGKSLLSLSVAIAVAGKSSLLGWRGTGRHGVLYVDGEMAGEQLQERANGLATANVADLPLYFLARDLCPKGMPTLNKQELRRVIEDHVATHDLKLIVLDNLSTLWRGDENEAQAWDQMQDWLFQLRRNCSVLIVHHAGKNGSQRGSSRKEDALDVVIALRRPSVDSDSSGAAFNVGFDKTRAFIGEATRSFHAYLRTTGARGLEAWERAAVKVDVAALQSEVAGMHEKGTTQREIASALNISQSKVSRMLKKSREDGVALEEADADTDKEVAEV